ncbi:MAG: MBL fold metallo-hydrolase, partial [Gemmatimonadales bacterium]|nr:MBL fold metallo-hydrolase [Gemmatimonadales bacterium]
RTVETPGLYTLVVTARADGLIAQRRVDFEILLTGSSLLILRVLDLGSNDAGGGGDAILVTDSSASGLVHALVDAGPAGANAADPGFVARRLAALGVDSLAFVVLTHAHSDHYAGLPSVLARFPVARFYFNGQVRSLRSYTEVLDSARARADTLIVPAAVAQLAVGRDTARTQVVILPPLPDWIGTDTDNGSLLNEGSLGVRLQRGSFEVFLTGDGEVLANARWRTQFQSYTRAVDALKVGHHGANDAIFDNGFSGNSTWLAQTAPAVALVSANGTSHPRISATGRLLTQPGLRTYCTNVHGTIEIRINPEGRYRVDVERNRDANCVPGSNADS